MKTNDKKNYIIDFDSTFTQVEALDELCEISLKNDPEKDSILAEIKAITDKGMAGDLSLRQSLEERLNLLKANKNHLPFLVEILKGKVSRSFVRNKSFLFEQKENIYIVSNGFKEFITPVVEDYGIEPDHVLANNFTFDEIGQIIGFDKDNVLSENKGKARKIEELQLEGEIIVIGDGYTDYEIKLFGQAHKFIAFIENAERPKVVAKADLVAKSLDEIIQVIQ